MSFAITTDSTADLPVSFIKQNHLYVFPLPFQLQDKPMRDIAGELDVTALYARLRAGDVIRTAQVTEYEYQEQFRKLLEAGHDVLHVGFSNALSGSVQGAFAAAAALSAEFPKRKLLIVDSLSASLGQGLAVQLMIDMRAQGKSIEEAATWLTENRLRIKAWFTVDDLNFLRRGGRVSATAAFLGTMLNIKPVLHVNREGRLIPVEKVKGRSRSLKALHDRMKAECSNPAAYPVFISHGDCETDARHLGEMIRESMGVSPALISMVGPVVGGHSGPGTVALFFVGDTATAE